MPILVAGLFALAILRLRARSLPLNSAFARRRLAASGPPRRHALRTV